MSGLQLRVSRYAVAEIKERLSDRDRQVLEHVARLRLMCARQIEALLFPPERHATPATAARCCRRVLERLTREQLLVRLERRVGGARFGSASFVYALGPLGQRVLDDQGPRKRLREPSRWFVAHTLAITQFVVALTVEGRAAGWELIEWQAEPASWRQVSTLGGRLLLKPDLFVVIGVGEFEVRWFVEIDRGTEHLPALTRKCRLYHSYYKNGSEQRAHGVFPRVLWLMPDEPRVARLLATVESDARLTAELFRIATHDQAFELIGATP